jgi:hypothetical protein
VQRTGAYDLNHSFEANVKTMPGMDMNMHMTNNTDTNTMVGAESSTPAFDSFAWLAIGLSLIVASGSAFYLKKSKQQLRQTNKALKKG